MDGSQAGLLSVLPVSLNLNSVKRLFELRYSYSDVYARKLDVLNRGLSGYNTEWAIPVFEQVSLAMHTLFTQTRLQSRGMRQGYANTNEIDPSLTVLRETTRTTTRSQSSHSHNLVWRK